jgi:hypothetical protein
MADRDGFIWYDGKLVPWRAATTHVLTHTLHYGMGVFEGIRAYKAEKGTAIFRLAEHTERLFNSAYIFQMKMPYDKETLLEAQKEVVRANQLESCYIRPIVFYGSEAMGIAATAISTHVAIAAWPWGAYLGAEGMEKGIRVKTSSFTRHHVNINMCRSKSVGTYTNSILAHQEVAHDGYDEALLLDVDGYVAEGRREHLHRQERQAVHTRPDVLPRGNHPRLGAATRRRAGHPGGREADHARRGVLRRRGLFHRHRRRSDADPRTRQSPDRRRPPRPDHDPNPEPVLRLRQRPRAGARRLACLRLTSCLQGCREDVPEHPAEAHRGHRSRPATALPDQGRTALGTGIRASSSTSRKAAKSPARTAAPTTSSRASCRRGTTEPPLPDQGSAPRSRPQPAMKALIVAPSWIGDTVLAQPLFMRLHERIPGLQLDALAPRWVAPVLERMPQINRIIDSPFAHGELSLKARHRLARQLAHAGLPARLRPAQFAQVGADSLPCRHPRTHRFHRRNPLRTDQPPAHAEQGSCCRRWPSASPSSPKRPGRRCRDRCRSRLHASSAQRGETLAALGVSLPAKLAVFCPGAEYGPAKRWPARHFATLASRPGRHGYAVWLLGSAKDQAGRRGDRRPCQPRQPAAQPLRHDLADPGDRPAGAASLCRLQRFRPDARRRRPRPPLIAVYGSSSPGFTPPLSEKATIISLNLECSPCFKRSARWGISTACNKLEPQRVLAACLGGVAA